MLLDLRPYIDELGDDRVKHIISCFDTVFNSPQGQEIMDVLIGFCAAEATTIQKTDRETFVMEGRRQVYLFIQEWLSKQPQR